MSGQANRTLTGLAVGPCDGPVADVEFTLLDGGVGEITLNRPARRNALTATAVASFDAILAGLGDEVAALVVRGAGGCFCSGIDLAELPREPAAADAWSLRWQSLHTRLATLDVPVVAALERAAVNAGAALALAADLVVTGETAFLQIMEVAKGMVPWANTAWLVAKHGTARTLDLTLTGRRVAGPELVRLGLAHRCVPDAEVVDSARQLATQLAEQPRDAVAATKQLIRTLSDPAAAIATARPGK
jgi:enoyl-CoA hydratase/carnithine racemase